MSQPTTEESHTDEGQEPGGLGEVLPDPLKPLWRPFERLQAFRETNSDTYISVMEAVIAVVLISGYLWWLYLFVM